MIKDPTGGFMVSVPVEISNPVTGFKKATTTDAMGRYSFTNLPPNPYHVAVTTQGFAAFQGDVDVRSGVPMTFDIALTLAGASTEVQVSAHAEDVLERDPTAHTDVDQSLIAKMARDSSSGLNQVVTLASPGSSPIPMGSSTRSAIMRRRSSR